MDAVFDWCVQVLVYWAGVVGITYKQINVWVFVILWPLVTLAMLGVIIWQRRLIRRLTGKNTHVERKPQ